MKKLMFTAIALVAFSSVSMSNTIAENQESNVVAVTDCCIIYDLAYNLAISEGASGSTADAAAQIAYNNCEKSNKKSISAN